MTYRLDTKRPHTAILIKLISLASIGATLFTPGLPAIKKFFQISAGDAQFALTLFLVGYACGQLIYSPFANRFGRKPVIFGGLVISMIGSLFSALAGPFDSFTLLVVSRFVTAIGASVGLVLTMTLVNDYYYEHQARKVIPLISTAFAVVPFLGVAIGGVLVHNFGWESCFYFLLVYYAVVFFFSRKLPETGTNLSRDATRMSTIIKSYGLALKDKRLVLFSTLFGMTTGMIYIFAATGPLIAINTIKISPQTYGLLNLINAATYLAGNLFAARYAKKISLFGMIRLGLTCFGVGYVVLLICFSFGMVNPLTLFAPFALAFFGIPVAFASTIVLASSHYEDRASGAAMMNFFNMTIALIATLIVQNLPGPLTVSMPILMVALSVVYLVLFKYAKRYAS
ncbi:MAG: multidrug effflux MFS transporter [Chlamydiia bacterium]|nr:multidrug effflux MFS transporter [Chlamydiia bacterium]